jgi:hypothetical protein
MTKDETFPREWQRHPEPYARPWTLEQLPMFADWIVEIDAPLEAIAETIRKPVFFMPLLQSSESKESGNPELLFDIRVPHSSTLRDIGRIFQARATYRIAHGDIDGAIGDKLTIHRLGRLISQKASRVQHFYSKALEGMATEIPIGANPEHPLTEQQIRRILEGLDSLPPFAPLEDVYEWERFVMLSSLQPHRQCGKRFDMNV